MNELDLSELKGLRCPNLREGTAEEKYFSLKKFKIKTIF